MERQIYIKLLEEGTNVYRPVTALKIDENIYEIKDNIEYDSDDEKWEFVPGTKVIVENKKLENEVQLVTVSKYVNTI